MLSRATPWGTALVAASTLAPGGNDMVGGAGGVLGGVSRPPEAKRQGWIRPVRGSSRREPEAHRRAPARQLGRWERRAVLPRPRFRTRLQPRAPRATRCGQEPDPVDVSWDVKPMPFRFAEPSLKHFENRIEARATGPLFGAHHRLPLRRLRWSFGWLTSRCQTTAQNPSVWGVMRRAKRSG